MDRQIKEALEQRASEAAVPADAWEKQRALLLSMGTAGGPMVRRPWWRRVGNLAEVAAVTLLMVGLVAAGAAYGPLGPGPGGGDDVTGGTEAVEPLVGNDLNPVVNPPTPRVVVAVTPEPAQASAVAAAVAAVERGAGVRGGQLTLSRIELVADRWQVEFSGDGRAFAFSGGPPPEDPRKGAYSHVVPVGRLTFEIDRTTGEIYSTGTTGRALDTGRTDLEHYRGFIVSGGQQTMLRLVRAEGGWDGRDLAVWVPGQALTASGLELWHLNYGTGRLIDVWGLTAATGEVLAHRVDMKERPSEELLAHDVIHGIPLPDGARVTKQISPNGAGYTVEGYTVESLRAWYLEQMPRYGWELGKPTPSAFGNTQVFHLVAYGWQFATVAIRPDPKGAQFDLQWGDVGLPIQNQQQAVAAVFRELGDDPAYQQFPRTPGSAPGAYNIGGPPPGQTIPGTYVTSVRTLPDGAWEVELAIVWGKGLYTFSRGFRVEPDGIVHRAGQWGEQPPAIP